MRVEDRQRAQIAMHSGTCDECGGHGYRCDQQGRIAQLTDPVSHIEAPQPHLIPMAQKFLCKLCRAKAREN